MKHTATLPGGTAKSGARRLYSHALTNHQPPSPPTVNRVVYCNNYRSMSFTPNALLLLLSSGQSGGRDTDKAARSAGEGFPWDLHQPLCQALSVPHSVEVVPDCTSYLTMHMVSKQVHRLAFSLHDAYERPQKVVKLPRYILTSHFDAFTGFGVFMCVDVERPPAPYY